MAKTQINVYLRGGAYMSAWTDASSFSASRFRTWAIISCGGNPYRVWKWKWKWANQYHIKYPAIDWGAQVEGWAADCKRFFAGTEVVGLNSCC